MIRIYGTILAGLLGLAFGSFLNVCLSRWPQGESVVRPRSHCRSCGRTLACWENLPVLSWIALRGRCRTCKAGIGWRYTAVELAVGLLWALTTWRVLPAVFSPDVSLTEGPLVFLYTSGLDIALGRLILYWALIALGVLDAEHLWLPNWITLTGIGLGISLNCAHLVLADWIAEGSSIGLPGTIAVSLLAVSIPALASAGLILLIRWVYWLIRRREGIGLGDAKLMAMLGAWLGLSGALLSFGIGVVMGAFFALVALAVPAARRDSETWLAAKLPLGTFLCVGGIVSALWGQPIIDAYLRWAGF
ncbi:MAG: prepilin peptidase [Acidobacteria bacterium]|nr:prepilin peptidase [Acidobacteriota bacterium]